jgi:hypothetical protein
MNFSKYLIVLILFNSCENQKSKIINYGKSKNEGINLEVPLKLSSFKNYGLFIERVRKIICNDSIPKIVVKQKNITRNFFINEQCEPIIFDPDGKHYVTFKNGKPHEWQTINEINKDSLYKKLSSDFLYLNDPKFFLVIIESEKKNNMKGIETFLIELTQEYDNMKTDLELVISFWEVVPNLPQEPSYK